MAFLYPAFLFGLFALVIPVLIHLFNFRRYKKIYFTNVHYLSEIKQETRKRSRLRQLLILLARLLAIASIVIAFAQPYIPSPKMDKNVSARQIVSIYVDNSFSMDAVSSTGTLFDNARTKAREIVAAYKPTDQFQLITNDFEGRHQAYLTPDEFLTQLDEIKLSPVTRPISQVVLRQKDLASQFNEKTKDLYLVSDFQKTSSDLSKIRPDSTTSIFLLPLKAEQRNNLSIDSVWFSSPVQQPGQTSILNVRVVNYGSESREKIPLKLRINDIQKAVASVDLPPGGYKDVLLPFVNDLSGFPAGVVDILDYPIIHDDKFYFTYPLSNILSLLCISQDKENTYLNALFADDTLFSIRNSNANQLNYSSFPSFSTIILDGLEQIPTGLSQELTRFVNYGGSLVIFPSLKPDLKSYDAFLQGIGIPSYSQADTSRLRVDLINLESPLFSDVFEKNASGSVSLPDNVDLPIVFQHFKLSHRTGLESIMQLNNGDVFLASGNSGRGTVYLFTSPMTDGAGNFPKHLMFVPVMYKIALLSQHGFPLYYISGLNQPVEVASDTINEKEIFRFKQRDTGFEMIPEARRSGTGTFLYPEAQVRDAGIYSLLKGELVVSEAAFNYDRRESSMETMSNTELDNIMKQSGLKNVTVFGEKKTPITKQIHEFRQGRRLFQIFLIFALIFMAFEVAVIRLMR